MPFSDDLKFLPTLKLPGEGTFLDYASDQLKKIRDEDAEGKERSLLFAGNSSCGKTTLIHKLFNIDGPVKPTFIMEMYSSPTDLLEGWNMSCTAWELQGGTMYGQALEFLRSSPNMTVVLCMDLSKPQYLFHTQQEVLSMLLNFFSSRSDADRVLKERMAQMPKDHPDKQFLQPFPVPLMVVGCMYDIFNKFEPEKKRVITQFMRYVAHINGGYLFYSTDRNDEVYKKAKAILKHYAFGNDIPKEKRTDYSRAVIVPPYCDSLADIDPSAGYHSADRYKLLLEQYFPQETITEAEADENISDDPRYREPSIDLIREQVKSQLFEDVNKGKYDVDIIEEFGEKTDMEDVEEYLRKTNPFADITPGEEKEDNEVGDVIHQVVSMLSNV